MNTYAKYRHVTLARQTLMFLQSIDPYRQLSEIIDQLSRLVLENNPAYDPYSMVVFKGRLVQLYDHEISATNLKSKAIDMLKKVKDHYGFKSLAEALDFVVYYYVQTYVCENTYLRSVYKLC